MRAGAQAVRQAGQARSQVGALRQPDPGDALAAALVSPEVPGGVISEAGVRGNVSVALQYLNAWLGGTGAAAIFNLMEDAATAEISRAQLWGWREYGVVLETGETFTAELYERFRDDERAKLTGEHLAEAAELLDRLVLDDAFAPFLTLEAYKLLD